MQLVKLFSTKDTKVSVKAVLLAQAETKVLVSTRLLLRLLHVFSVGWEGMSCN